ncbi:MAG: HAD hydrolase-like protein, partial [Patescibacteria group bacterium]
MLGIILSNSKTAFKRKDEIEGLFKSRLFLSGNKKPFQSLFKEINSEYDLKTQNFLVVGDRIITDILFGNINSATTILVKPLVKEKDVFRMTKRILENSLVYILKFILR